MSTIRVGLIGGTGLAQALVAQTAGTPHEVTTPFGRPSDTIVETEWEGLPLLFLSRHGPGHRLNPSQVPFRANIYALKQLGCTHIIASGAVGSLREEIHPRDLVIPDQIIDRTSRRPSTFYENVAVHVEMAEPFCPVLRQILVEAGRQTAAAMASAPAESQAADGRFTVHERGCYVCMEGPAFSTRAESLMHRLWGGDLIGMSAMPEAKLAREAEISYALVALVTDYDCWRAQPPGGKDAAPADKSALLKEILAHLEVASANAIALMRRAVALLAARRNELPPSPAHSALDLAIWSDRSAIAAEEIQRLAPLWARRFA